MNDIYGQRADFRDITESESKEYCDLTDRESQMFETLFTHKNHKELKNALFAADI